MGAKYVDISSIVQVIGCIYQNPGLLDSEKYVFNEEDFTEDFHRIIFGSIFNLHALGAQEINITTIEDYLEQRPTKLGVYNTHKGREFLQKIPNNIQLATFDYYYQRMKKMSLLRGYQSIGYDCSWLYDINNIFDQKKKQAQEDWLDNTPIEDIADLIDKKILDVRLKYVDNAIGNVNHAADGALELLERLKEVPEIGYPLYGSLINTITRGARLKKFYLRSAATGVGKTRALIADACYIACDRLFNSKTNKWEQNGTKEPTLFIATEQDLEEVQTMMIAFIAEVDEAHIIDGEYFPGEWERVTQAAAILKETPLYVVQLPDFSLQDIENTIKFNIREYDVKYVFFDYIHSSMKILSEVTSKTGIKGLREDNVLFMISIRLKDLCNQYGIFIMAATQLNADYVTAKQYDQNLLRGAKAIADKIDVGMIMLQTSPEDITALEPMLQKHGYDTPGIKISVYKNRRGKHKGILLWCKDNRGTCKIEPMFVTNYQYELLEMDDWQIKVKQESAF